MACLTLFLLCIQFSTAGDQPRVFVYAQWDTPPRSWTLVSCDDGKIAEVKQGFFFAITLSQGRHLLALKDGVPLPLDLHTGDDTFVRVDRHYAGSQPPILILSTVPAETATKEMRFLTYIEKKRIHSANVPKEDPRPPATPHLNTRQSQ
jgi:hypothetical protein